MNREELKEASIEAGKTYLLPPCLDDVMEKLMQNENKHKQLPDNSLQEFVDTKIVIKKHTSPDDNWTVIKILDWLRVLDDLTRRNADDINNNVTEYVYANMPLLVKQFSSLLKDDKLDWNSITSVEKQGYDVGYNKQTKVLSFKLLTNKSLNIQF